MRDKLWGLWLIIYAVLGAAAISNVIARLIPSYAGLAATIVVSGLGGWAAGRCAVRAYFFGRVTNG